MLYAELSHPGGIELYARKCNEVSIQGFSLGQIAKILGVSKSTVKNYIDDYPYRSKRRFSL